MTECNRKTLTFSSLSRKKILADFNGGRLTSDGGALLLREANRRTGLIDALAGCVADPRDPAKTRHEVKTMLTQRVCGIAMGYEDGNDHQTLREDPIMQILSEIAPDPDDPLASPATLSRFENWVNRKSLARMGGVFVDQFTASHAKPPEEIVLDFDATEDAIHGNQEGKFFHGYYDCYCYLPLYVFCGDQLLCAYLRPSKIDGAKHARGILKLLVQRIRAAWPNVRIIFRGDSGFCRWKTLKYCDKNDIGYVVGLATNATLKRHAKPHMEAAQKAYDTTGLKQRDFHEFMYGAKSWDRKRRIILKAEHLDKGANARFVVTNLDRDPADIYDGLYTQRGDMENRIKEQQLYLFADRTSCSRFVANQFRLLLTSAAYLLVEHLRRESLAGTELARAQVSTIRLKLFKIAARVVVSVRRVVLHLSGGYPYQSLLTRLVAQLAET
jgi:Transposase DDE domain group 1